MSSSTRIYLTCHCCRSLIKKLRQTAGERSANLRIALKICKKQTKTSLTAGSMLGRENKKLLARKRAAKASFLLRWLARCFCVVIWWCKSSRKILKHCWWCSSSLCHMNCHIVFDLGGCIHCSLYAVACPLRDASCNTQSTYVNLYVSAAAGCQAVWMVEMRVHVRPLAKLTLHLDRLRSVDSVHSSCVVFWLETQTTENYWKGSDRMV